MNTHLSQLQSLLQAFGYRQVPIPDDLETDVLEYIIIHSDNFVEVRFENITFLFNEDGKYVRASFEGGNEAKA